MRKSKVGETQIRDRKTSGRKGAHFYTLQARGIRNHVEAGDTALVDGDAQDARQLAARREDHTDTAVDQRDFAWRELRREDDRVRGPGPGAVHFDREAGGRGR